MTGHGEQGYSPRVTTPPLLTVDETAVFLGISRRQVYRLVQSGELRPLRIGSRFRFRLRDLEAAP